MLRTPAAVIGWRRTSSRTIAQKQVEMLGVQPRSIRCSRTVDAWVWLRANLKTQKNRGHLKYCNFKMLLKSNNWVNGSHIDLVRFVNQQTQRGGFHLTWYVPSCLAYVVFFSTTKLGEDVFSHRKTHIITHDPGYST